MSQDDVTIGEVYRRLVDMDDRYEAKLNGIDTQVRITNGRTTKLETQMTTVRGDVRDLKLKHVSPSVLAPTVAQEPGESLSVKISPAMWKFIAAAAGAGGAFLLQKMAGS